MTKESILYNNLGINTYELHATNLIKEGGMAQTYYTVTWHCKYGMQSSIEQAITETEYYYLLKELNKEANKETNNKGDNYDN